MIITCPSCAQKNRIPASKLAQEARCGQCKTPLDPQDHPIAADPDIFDDITQNATVPILIDFWAPWCGPCRMAAPHLEQVAKQHKGRALVLKVNTDEHPQLAARFQVRGIPHFVVMSGGRVVHSQSGLVPAQTMSQWLDRATPMQA